MARRNGAERPTPPREIAPRRGTDAVRTPQATTDRPSMITKATPTAANSSVQERITRRAFAQAMAMIHMANNRE